MISKQMTFMTSVATVASMDLLMSSSALGYMSPELVGKANRTPMPMFSMFSNDFMKKVSMIGLTTDTNNTPSKHDTSRMLKEFLSGDTNIITVIGFVLKVNPGTQFHFADIDTDVDPSILSPDNYLEYPVNQKGFMFGLTHMDIQLLKLQGLPDIGDDNVLIITGGTFADSIVAKLAEQFQMKMMGSLDNRDQAISLASTWIMQQKDVSALQHDSKVATKNPSRATNTRAQS